MGGTVGHHVAAPVAVGVVARIVAHDHAVASARGAVGVPLAVARVGMAVVADESGVIVTLVHVSTRHVVVVVAIGCDAGRQVGEDDVWVALDPLRRR